MDDTLNHGEPGAARHGNFISYYNFHPPEDRLKLLPFEKILALCSNDFEQDEDGVICTLDVGCNTGELTEQITKSLESLSGKRCYTLAIDIDPILIQRAREASNSALQVEYHVGDVSSPEFHGIATAFLRKIGRQIFDVSFLFSITMWIHLNGGDNALKRSLIEVTKLSSTVVLEPQPWKCYRGAVRRMKRANAEPFQHFNELKMRSQIEDDIEGILVSVCNMKKVVESARTSWGRKLYVFHRAIDSVQ